MFRCFHPPKTKTKTLQCVSPYPPPTHSEYCDVLSPSSWLCDELPPIYKCCKASPPPSRCCDVSPQEAAVCSPSDKGWCCYVSFHRQAAEQASIVQKVDQHNPPPPDDVQQVEAFKLHPPLYVHDGQVVQCDQLHSQLQDDVSLSFHALRLLKKQPQHRKLTATFFLHLNLFTMLKLPTIIPSYLVLIILCMQPVISD